MLCFTIDIDGRPLTFPFREDRLTVGSAADNEAVIPSRHVSRHHLLLELDGDAVRLTDLGSRNGTFVGDRRVVTERLRWPCELRLGSSLRAWIGHEPTEEVSLALRRPSQDDAPPARPLTHPDARDAPDAAAALLAELAAGAVATLPHRLVEAAARGAAAALVRLPGDGAPGGREPLLVAATATCPVDSLPLDRLRAAVPPGDGWGVLPGPDGAWSWVAPGGGLVALVQGEQPHERLLALQAALRAAHRHSAPAGSPATDGSRVFTLDVVPGAITGTSAAVRALHERLAAAAGSDLPVLLQGATGVGKEIYARALHLHSRRASRPFRAVNSSAFPEHLQEALLFGTEEGVATGVRRQPGLLREADGGTFLFDEIGEMGLPLQAKILRVLDHGEVLPVGSARPVQVDLRIVAATHRDLPAEVAAGRFREDLLYRLGGHVHRIPSLTEHAEDVPLYVAAFLESECRASGRHVPGVTVRAMQRLVAHDWPGNVRELEHLVRRLVHEVAPSQPITHAHLPVGLGAGRPPRGESLDELLDPHRRRIVLQALEDLGWNRSAAAQRLGTSRTRLRELMRRLEIADED